MPKKGDTVFFVDLFDYDLSETPNVHPAIVTKVRSDGSLDLFVMFMTGTFHKTAVPQGAPDQRGTWHL